MIGFQMFPRSRPNYVFVTKIPRMLILYFTLLKNKDHPPINDTCNRIGNICMFFFLFSSNVSYCFWQIVLLTYENKPLPIFVPLTLSSSLLLLLLLLLLLRLSVKNEKIRLSAKLIYNIYSE